MKKNTCSLCNRHLVNPILLIFQEKNQTNLCQNCFNDLKICFEKSKFQNKILVSPPTSKQISHASSLIFSELKIK